MKRILFLHIGMPKAGSSTVQQLLRMERSRLKEAGVLVPEVFGQSHAWLGLLAYSLPHWNWLAQTPAHSEMFGRSGPIRPLEAAEMRRRKLAQLDRYLRREQPAKVVLSDEGLYSELLPDEIETLRNILSRRFDEVRIFVVLREPLEYAVSEFGQLIVSGYAFQDVKIQPPGQRAELAAIHGWPIWPGFSGVPHVCEYSDRLSWWETAFPNCVSIHLLDTKGSSASIRLPEHFLHFLGVSAERPVGMLRQNSSLDLRRLNTLNFVNRFWPSFANGRRRWNYDDVWPLLNAVTPGRGQLMANTAQRAAYTEFFRSSNELTRARYFPNMRSLWSSDHLVDYNSAGQASGDASSALEELIARRLVRELLDSEQHVSLSRKRSRFVGRVRQGARATRDLAGGLVHWRDH